MRSVFIRSVSTLPGKEGPTFSGRSHSPGCELHKAKVGNVRGSSKGGHWVARHLLVNCGKSQREPSAPDHVGLHRDSPWYALKL